MRREMRKAGLLSGAPALSFLWAASKLSPFPKFPPHALAERIVRLTPGGIATFCYGRPSERRLRRELERRTRSAWLRT